MMVEFIGVSGLPGSVARVVEEQENGDFKVYYNTMGIKDFGDVKEENTVPNFGGGGNLMRNRGVLWVAFIGMAMAGL